MEWTDNRFHIVGYLPQMLSEDNPASAQEQLHNGYLHGGGWNDFHGFILGKDEKAGKFFLQYPGDPPMRERSRTTLRNETVVLFDSSWVAVIQPDETFRVARFD